MKKKDKIFLLKTAQQLVYRCSEHTPPSVKSSELNISVAKAALSISDVIAKIKSKTS